MMKASDCLNLRAAFDWSGHFVENSVDLAPVLENALAEDGPSLIVLPFGYSENMKLTKRLGNISCPI